MRSTECVKKLRLIANFSERILVSKSIRPGPFQQILGQFRIFLNGFLRIIKENFVFLGFLRNFTRRGHPII